MAYNTFPRKGYGVIFVEKEEDIPKVKEIIKKMDEFEYSYLPEKLIQVFNPNIRTFPKENPKDYLWLDLNHTFKFDSLDLNELQFRCWAAGIKIFCCMGSGKDYECYEISEEDKSMYIKEDKE